MTEVRTLRATTRSLSRKEFWEKKLNEMGIEYEVDSKTYLNTWYEFSIKVTISGAAKDLNYTKICNTLCIPDEMIDFYYKE